MDFQNSSAYHYLQINAEKMHYWTLNLVEKYRSYCKKQKWAKIRFTDCRRDNWALNTPSSLSCFCTKTYIGRVRGQGKSQTSKEEACQNCLHWKPTEKILNPIAKSNFSSLKMSFWLYLKVQILLIFITIF